MSRLAIWRPSNLDTGLDHPYAENILRAMDADGKVGLRNAEEALLTEARKRTRGYPRALEHLFGILSADRDTTLIDILDNTKQLLPDQVTEVLVGEAFSRLDLTAQRVMQALAIYRYPVSPPAVDYLLQPFVPGIDSGKVLSRLVNMQFVRRDAGRYYLHQIDRDFAESRLPDGEPADRAAQVPTFSRFALHHRAAEWFKLARKPRESWKTLDDLAAQLSEFELRYAGRDYDTAAGVLVEIDYDYLNLWGHYQLLTELHERLQSKISDQTHAQYSASSLGYAHYQMGQHRKAVNLYESALSLARQSGDRQGEGTHLGALSLCYFELGQSDKALDYQERSLAISREVGDRNGEATFLNNLGGLYACLGQLTRAMEYETKALEIARALKSRRSEATSLCNLGSIYSELGQPTEAHRCLNSALTISKEIRYRSFEAAAQNRLGAVDLDNGEWTRAASAFETAVEIADDIVDPQEQQLARRGLAEAHFYQGNLASSRDMAEAARRYNYPRENHATSALLGVVAWRQADRAAAFDAFATALGQAVELLSRSPQFYGALDTKGLALCGLALCETPSHIPAAKEAFSAARALTSAPGIVARVLRLFDALAPADPSALLAEVRPYAAGEAAQSASGA